MNRKKIRLGINVIRYVYIYIRNKTLLIPALLFGKRMPLYNKILVIAPHPDDETLGCGGLIRRTIEGNKSVYIVLLTGGENCFFDSGVFNKDFLKEKRRELTKMVAKSNRVPIENIFFLDFKDGGVNDKDFEMNKLIAILDSINPDAVFFPHHFEIHNDHVQANAIMRKITNKSADLFEYCVWFWYFMPFNKIISISWKNSYLFSMRKDEKEAKKNDLDIYLDAKNEAGRRYSGDMTKILLRSCYWKKELFFKINKKDLPS